MSEEWCSEGLDDIQPSPLVEEAEELLSELEEIATQLPLSAQSYIEDCRVRMENNGRLSRAHVDVLKDIKREKHDTPAGW